MSVTRWQGVTLTIQVAFTQVDFIIGESLLGDSLGPTPVWTDITAYVQNFTTHRGRQRSLEKSPAGTATFQLKNQDGRFDPTFLTGPYVADGATQVMPGVPVRVRATYAATPHDIWYGNADGWDGSWAVHRAGQGAAWASLTASGVFDWAAGAELEAGPAQGEGDLSGERVNRVLDALAWSTERRTIDDGTLTMQNTTLEGAVIDSLQSAADSENGVVIEGADGSIVFYDSASVFTRTESASAQATYGDGTGELRYQNITSSYDKDLVKNVVVLGRQRQGSGEATTVSVEDGVSRRQYGPRTYTNTSLQNANDTDLEGLAASILEQFKDADLRFDSIVVNPQHNPSTLWPEVLGRDLRDRLRVIRRPKAGNTIDRQVFVESISHSVTHDVWTTTYTFSSSSAFPDNPFIIDVSLLGGTDVLVF